jgi:hypothetical protein
VNAPHLATDPGLTPQLAHNAVAAVVEMYRAAIDTGVRRERMMMARIAQLEGELAVLKKDLPPDATRAPQGG